MGPVPYVMISETLSPQIRGLATWICITVLWLLAFLVGKFFNTVSDAIGLHVCFWFFALCCILATIFHILVLPETKNKSLEAILHELSGKEKKNINSCSKLKCFICLFYQKHPLRMPDPVSGSRQPLRMPDAVSGSRQPLRIQPLRMPDAVSANLSTFSYGSFVGWASPAILELQSDHSAIGGDPITDEDASWIGSLMFIGFLCGTPVYSWLSDRFGRKPAALLTSIPIIVNWLIIIFSETVFLIFIARFIVGISIGGILTIMPIYVGEISEVHVRGTLGTILSVLGNGGILFSYAVGAYSQ
ncbi:hypothetical protein L9F63_026488, partial [Diploptera punctata]